MGGGPEREGDTESEAGSRLPSCQHRAGRGARTHKLQDHDLSQSLMLNWLSHPGAPILPFSNCLLKNYRFSFLNIHISLIINSSKIIRFLQCFYLAPSNANRCYLKKKKTKKGSWWITFGHYWVQRCYVCFFLRDLSRTLNMQMRIIKCQEGKTA